MREVGVRKTCQYTSGMTGPPICNPAPALGSMETCKCERSRLLQPCIWALVHHLSILHWLRLDGSSLCSPVGVISCLLYLPSWLLHQDREQRLPQPLPAALVGRWDVFAGFLSTLTTQLSCFLPHLTGEILTLTTWDLSYFPGQWWCLTCSSVGDLSCVSNTSSQQGCWGTLPSSWAVWPMPHTGTA